LQEVTNLYEASNWDILTHHAHQEELAQHIEGLVAEVQKECDACERTKSQIEKANCNINSEMCHSHHAYKVHEALAQTTQTKLAHVQALLGQPEVDISALQAALSAQEAAAKIQGKHVTTAWFLSRFDRTLHSM
jgi:hypothetical protein